MSVSKTGAGPLRIPLTLGSEKDADEQLYDDWRTLEANAAPAERRAGAFTGRCQGCGEFTTNLAARHECGYFPGHGWLGR